MPVVFSSPIFIFLFLPVVLGLYFIFPKTWRNPVLIVASLLFYAWGESKFFGILILSIVFNYFCGRLIHAAGKTRRGAGLLVLAITVDLAFLVVFKYGGFLTWSIVNPFFRLVGLPPMVIQWPHLPIGISFYTFHALSYLIDIYRGSAEVQRNLGTTALYITLFPQLVAGPIVRYKEIASQFIQRNVSLADFAAGIQRFAIGLGKKMLIANSVAITADQVFSLPGNQLTAAVAWLGVIAYTLQIYFDFSGYSDMAIGLARMFGFRFPENFGYPYISQSVQEFWRRWHISLSSWFRDYLYIPLGGNRRSGPRTYLNLLIVFFLCGLWHGASWTFVIWGLYHGAFLVLERLGLGARLTKWPRLLRLGYTLLVVMIGWVFFRADSVSQAGAIIAAMFGFASQGAPAVSAASYISPAVIIAILAGVIGSTPVPARWIGAATAKKGPGWWPTLWASEGFRKLWIGAVFLFSLVQVAADTYNPFIYFRF